MPLTKKGSKILSAMIDGFPFEGTWMGFKWSKVKKIKGRAGSKRKVKGAEKYGK